MVQLDLPIDLQRFLNRDALMALRPRMAERAQEIYDAWHQDENGLDPELGSGGICQDIAAGISEVLADAGAEKTGTSHDEEINHVATLVRALDGIFLVDIPPSIYEQGRGYVWRKIPNVDFVPADIAIERLDADPAAFSLYAG